MSVQLSDRPASDNSSDTDFSINLAPFIDWTQPATALANLITFLGAEPADQASNSHPAARARINGQCLHLLNARAGGLSSVYPPGTIIRCDREVWIQTGTGHLVLETILDSTGQTQTALDFCTAHALTDGHRFDLIRPWHQHPSSTTLAA